MQKILGLALGVTVMMMGYVDGMQSESQVEELVENKPEKQPGDALTSPTSKMAKNGECITALGSSKPGTPPDVKEVNNLDGLQQNVVSEPSVEFGDDAMSEKEKKWRAYSRGVLVLLQTLRAEKNFSSAENDELNTVITTWLDQLKENGVLATVSEDLRTTVYGGTGFSAEKLDRVELLFSTAEICLHYATYCNNDVQNKLNTLADELLNAAKNANVLNEDGARHSTLESEDILAAKLRRVIERINGD